jgi:hypothetical protein
MNPELELGAEKLDIGSLLTIDVESELRKLTQAQLQGPWQLPAELVRRAIGAGATRVEVELGRTQLRVRSEGGGVPYSVLRELAALLDSEREPQRRHQALAALERAGALALLGVVGLGPASVRIISPRATPDGRGLQLSWTRGGVEFNKLGSAPPSTGLDRAPASTGVDPAEHAEVLVRGAKIDRTRAREWLAEVARYAPIEILVDGRPLLGNNQPFGPGSGGFADAFALTRVTTPVPALLALPREGEAGRLYLLQDGLVTTHLSVPAGPCFEAAIETRELAEPSASAARLRELIEPQIPAIVDAAIAWMIRVGHDGARLDPRDRSRLTQLLLQGARRDRERAKTIARVPLFRGLERDGRERWCDLLALRQSIQDEGGERLLTALFPDQDPAEFAAEARIFVLDESERALLGELLELGFRQPRRRVGARRGLARWIHDLPQLLRGRALFSALRPGGRPIPDVQLDPAERHFLFTVRAQLEDVEVHMCTGRGPIRRRGHHLLLPRGSAKVGSAVIAVAADPAWVYPALLALLEGQEFPERARRGFRLV